MALVSASGKGSTGSKLVSGIGANWLRLILTQGGNVLLVPLFLRVWGAVVYGEWLTVAAATGYLSLLDLGIQNYVVNRMGQSYAVGRLTELHRDLHSGLRVYLVLVALGFAATLAIVSAVPIAGVLDLRTTNATTVALTVLFLASNTLLLSIPRGLIVGIYKATDGYARGHMVANAIACLELLLTASLLWLGYSMAVLAGSWFLFNAGATAVFLWDLRRFRPAVTIGIRRGTLRHGWTLIGPGFLFLVMSLAMLLNIQGVLLLLNRFVSSVAVAQFSTLRTLANLVAQVGQTVNLALWPELTAVEARGERLKLQSVCLSLVKFNVSFAILGALVLRTVGPTLYLLWTGRALSFNPLLLDVFLLQAVLMVFWTSSGLVLVASNNQSGYAWSLLLNAAVTIALSVLLVRRFGATGVAVASLLGDVLCCLWLMPHLASRLLDQPSMLYWRSVMLPGLTIAAVIVVVPSWLGAQVGDTGLSPLLVSSLVLPLYVGATYVFWMNPDERTIVRQLPERLWAAIRA